MRNLTVLLTTLVPTLALAQGAAKPAAAPPAPKMQPPMTKPEPMAAVKPPAEVAEVVGLFKKNWAFDGSLQAPGMDKPAKFKMTFNCKATAGGVAVSCESKAKTPMGPYDGAFLIGYDPFSKAVHVMGVTNMYEIHDHVCQLDHGMADKTAISCAAYKGGMGADGQAITEDLMIAFAKKEATFTSTTHMKDGSTITFSGTAKR